MERSEANNLFDLWAKLRFSGATSIIFPCYAATEPGFLEMVALDCDADNLCSGFELHPEQMGVCVEPFGHSVEHENMPRLVNRYKEPDFGIGIA